MFLLVLALKICLFIRKYGNLMLSRKEKLNNCEKISNWRRRDDLGSSRRKSSNPFAFVRYPYSLLFHNFHSTENYSNLRNTSRYSYTHHVPYQIKLGLYSGLMFRYKILNLSHIPGLFEYGLQIP